MSLRIGPHEFLVRLSTGQSKNTYLSRSERGDRPRLLTVKVLHPSAADSADHSRRFLAEARILAQIRHPSIIETAGYGVIGSLHCIATEFVFGVSLQEVLRAGARTKVGLSAPAVLRIIGSVLEGLDAAHRATDEAGRPLHLVHRAVTPANVLVGFNGSPKLSDFGLAKLAHRGWETMAGRVTGKTSYMSPEQILSRELDARSDVFCVGVVLWELLAGRRLFHGSKLMEIARAITRGRVPPPSRFADGLPEGTDELVLRALAKDPEQRFRSALEMASAIDQVFLSSGLAVEPSAVAMELARLFGPVIGPRARALKDALAGRDAEATLCEALDAQPIDAPDMLHDFVAEPPPPPLPPVRRGANIVDEATEIGAPVFRLPDDQATVVVSRPSELEGLVQSAGLRAASTVGAPLARGWNDTMAANLGDELRRMIDARAPSPSAPSPPAASHGDELLEETEQG